MVCPNIENALRRMGLTGCYAGYHYLVEGALLAREDPAALELVSKRVYPALAHRNHISIGGVDRAMRTAMMVCYRNCPEQVEWLCRQKGEPRIAPFLEGLSQLPDLEIPLVKGPPPLETLVLTGEG